MKVQKKQLQMLAKDVLKAIQADSGFEVFDTDEILIEEIVDCLNKNLHAEKLLDQEVEDMMDMLEKQNPGGFQRYKMFPLLKKKLASKKGFVL